MSRRARGLTLIELCVTIAIMAFVMTSVVGALSSTAVQGANRMIRQQATAIASAYLEEIMQRPVADPGGPAELGRADFDNVDDYNGLPDTLVHDQQGNALPGFADYRVSVQVVADAIAGLPAAANVRLINVTVTHTSGVTVLLSGYKTDHPLP